MTARRRYRLMSTLGDGGFGTVYQARLIGRGGFTKNVALKLPHPERASDPNVGERLREEARVLGLVRHRAIVHVDSLVLLNGSWTVVMEYVEGIDLLHALRQGPLPVRVALGIVEEVASALHVAFTTPGPDGEPLQLVHRDIKPANVLVTGAGEVKILDFGIARTRDEPTETTLADAGSRLYMSPERLDGIDDPRADVYSLGAVLFELVTGRSLGRTSSNPVRHARRRTVALAALRDALVDEAGKVVDLVGSMLAYHPTERPRPRQVERRCAELVGGLGGPRLREWAEAEVPGLLQARRDAHAADPFAELVLVEQTDQEAAECNPRELARRVQTPVGVGRRGDVMGDEVEEHDQATRPAFTESGKDDQTTLQLVGIEAASHDADTDTGAPPRDAPVLLDEQTATPAPAALTADEVAAESSADASSRGRALLWGGAAVALLLVGGVAFGVAWRATTSPATAADAAGSVTPEVSGAEASGAEASGVEASGVEGRASAEAGPAVEEPGGRDEAVAVAGSPEPAPAPEPVRTARPPAPEPSGSPEPTTTAGSAEPAPASDEAAADEQPGAPGGAAASADATGETPSDEAAVDGAGIPVETSGDEADVVLVGDGARHPLPSAVPPGEYAIEATFAGGQPVTAGRLVVPDEGALTVRCSALFLRCSGE